MARLVPALAAAAALGAAAPAHAADYVVLYRAEAPLASARLAVRAAGGTLVRENARIGVATAVSAAPWFAEELARHGAIEDVAPNEPIGVAARAARTGARPSGGAPPSAEPLAGLQWDMAMIRATAAGSYAVEPGDRGVRVGVLDTGIDGSHPDIAPSFDAALSRNFTTDIPRVDGPCEEEPDGACTDPADVDENGHGTHVAGTIASPLNGLGIAGVAPGVTLVSLRAGQDSGYFFLQATLDALTYAGDNGIDVVNMSYFIDPWLFNCARNPADSPAAQRKQRTIVAATNRALDYARRRGVTLIAAAGNEHTDYDRPTSDAQSPNYPPNIAYERRIDASCLVMPTEGTGVLSVGAVGPSRTKADYSNWGLEHIDVAAPGGYLRDLAGTPEHRTVATQILAPYPAELAIANGDVDETGAPRTPFVVRDCQGEACAYYQYLQGTSMAAPHAAGVAALIVSRHGKPDPGRGGLTLEPRVTERILRDSATHRPCPAPPVLDYTSVGRPASYRARCVARPGRNSIWGHGIVDALAAVR